MNLALWLKKNNFRLDQVQTFLPTPMALATTMYHTERNPLRKLSRTSEQVGTVRSGRQRKLHKHSCATTIRPTGPCCARRSRKWAAPT